MRLLIATLSPTTAMIPFETANCLINAISFAKQLYGYQNVDYSHVASPLVEENRNNIFEIAKDYDRLMMIDSDMVFEPHMIPQLMQIMDEKDADLVCGVFRSGTEPYPYTIYTKLENFETLKEENQGVKPIEACGTAFILIGKRPLEQFEKPFYRIDWQGKRLGQDLSFCKRLLDAGMKLYCDTQMKIGHLRFQAI